MLGGTLVLNPIFLKSSSLVPHLNCDSVKQGYWYAPQESLWISFPSPWAVASRAEGPQSHYPWTVSLLTHTVTPQLFYPQGSIFLFFLIFSINQYFFPPLMILGERNHWLGLIITKGALPTSLRVSSERHSKGSFKKWEFVVSKGTWKFTRSRSSSGLWAAQGRGDHGSSGLEWSYRREDFIREKPRPMFMLGYGVKEATSHISSLPTTPRLSSPVAASVFRSS